MRIYVDMDNTLCDFATPYLKALEETPEQAYPQAAYGFFTKLKEMPAAAHAMNVLSKVHDVWIATRPSFLNPLCYTEKRVWVEENLGKEWCDKLIIIPEKGLLIGDILIDDTPWPTFQGRQILYHKDDYNWFKILKELV